MTGELGKKAPVILLFSSITSDQDNQGAELYSPEFQMSQDLDCFYVEDFK